MTEDTTVVFSRHCVRLTVSGCAPRRKLPQDEAEGVHVDTQEGVPLEVDGTFQDFGSHVAPRSHLRVKKKKKKKMGTDQEVRVGKITSTSSEEEESHDAARGWAETVKSDEGCCCLAGANIKPKQ